MARRVQYTPPPRVGTYIQGGNSYAIGAEVRRKIDAIVARDAELLERLAAY